MAQHGLALACRDEAGGQVQLRVEHVGRGLLVGAAAALLGAQTRELVLVQRHALGVAAESVEDLRAQVQRGWLRRCLARRVEQRQDVREAVEAVERVGLEKSEARAVAAQVERLLVLRREGVGTVSGELGRGLDRRARTFAACSAAATRASAFAAAMLAERERESDCEEVVCAPLTST